MVTVFLCAKTDLALIVRSTLEKIKDASASSIAMNCGVGSSAGDKPTMLRLPQSETGWPKRIVALPSPRSAKSSSGN